MRHLSIFLLLATTPSFAEEALSVDEIGRELKNPATALASISNSIEYRTFKGNLPDADNQTSLVYAVQPVFPFPLANGDKIIFRPEFPLLFDEPVTAFDTTGNPTGFREADTALGDISFDLAYGSTGESTGLIKLYGIFATLPTATDDDVTGDQWLLGPEFALGVTDNWGVAAFLLVHQWDIAGDNKEATSISSLEYVFAYGLGDGWQLFTAPSSISYDWKAESGNKLTFPVGIGIEKTVKFGDTPVALSLFIEKYIEQADEFGPDIMIQFSFTPVIQNPFL